MNEDIGQIFELEYYTTANGKSPFTKWLNRLDTTTIAQVTLKIDALSCGHFGNVKFIGDGIYEFKIDLGPGYRIYHTRIGKKLLLILTGGDKKNQQNDITKAKKYLIDYREHHENK